MRICPINYGVLCANKPALRNNKQEKLQNNHSTSAAAPSFKGFGGKVVGGILGAGFGGLCALATMATPVGWIAAATFLAAETGGAVVGGKIGDAVTGKDDDN